MMMVPEHVLDLIPGYALSCLDEDETLQVAEHLVVCESCRDEFVAYQALVDRLGLAAPDAAPSAGVKAGLLRRAARNTTLPAAQKDQSRQRRAGFTWLGNPGWGFASLVVVLALLASNLLLWRQVTRLQTESGPRTLQVVNLANTEVAPGATGMIVISLDGEHGTLVVDRLPVLSEEQQYQLWLIEDGERTDGGVFSVGPSGYASMWVGAPIPLGDYDAFGITIEPAGGSRGPTGEKVLGG